MIEPLDGLVDKSKLKRKCKTLPDQQWIETGLLRILSQEISGKAFLQKIYDSGRKFLSRSLFFETLKSKRRLKLCQEINFAVSKGIVASDFDKDPFAQFSELDGFDISAGDGHYHSAAAHDIMLSNVLITRRFANQRRKAEKFYMSGTRQGSLLCNGLNGNMVRGFISLAGRKRTWTC